MIFIHELDTKAERYKEIITMNPWFALYKVLETTHDKNRFVLVRTTGNYYDILDKEERILRRLFDQIKSGEEQSIVIAEGEIDKDLKDFCDELYADEWCYESKGEDYDGQCILSTSVILWFRQDPTGYIYGYDIFETVCSLMEEKQWKGGMESFKKALMSIDKGTLKRFAEHVAQ